MLIIGSTGMAGHMLAKYFPEADTLDRSSGFDAFQTGKMRRYFSNITARYDYIVNCVGVLVQESENDPAAAIKINSVFPRTLEQIFKDTPTKIIHISTDCVFSGDAGGYDEDSVTDEKGIYGASKALGEIDNAKDITIRTSIIGPEIVQRKNPGLLEWYLNAEGSVDGWQNAYWNGITTLQLAKVVEQITQNPELAGVYHVHSEFHSKYRLLKKIEEVWQTGKEIVSVLKNPPVNKTLKSKRGKVFQIPSLELQLQELFDYCQK